MHIHTRDFHGGVVGDNRGEWDYIFVKLSNFRTNLDRLVQEGHRQTIMEKFQSEGRLIVLNSKIDFVQPLRTQLTVINKNCNIAPGQIDNREPRHLTNAKPRLKLAKPSQITHTNQPQTPKNSAFPTTQPNPEPTKMDIDELGRPDQPQTVERPNPDTKKTKPRKIAKARRRQKAKPSHQFRPKVSSTPDKFPKTPDADTSISPIKWKPHTVKDCLVHNITDGTCNHSEVQEHMEDTRIDQEPSKDIRNRQEPSEDIRNAIRPSEGIRNIQELMENQRFNQESSENCRHNQKLLEDARIDPEPSKDIRNLQEHSEAFSNEIKPSEDVRNVQEPMENTKINQEPTENCRNSHKPLEDIRNDQEGSQNIRNEQGTPENVRNIQEHSNNVRNAQELIHEQLENVKKDQESTNGIKNNQEPNTKYCQAIEQVRIHSRLRNNQEPLEDIGKNKEPPENVRNIPEVIKNVMVDTPEHLEDIRNKQKEITIKSRSKKISELIYGKMETKDPTENIRNLLEPREVVRNIQEPLKDIRNDPEPTKEIHKIQTEVTSMDNNIPKKQRSKTRLWRTQEPIEDIKEPIKDVRKSQEPIEVVRNHQESRKNVRNDQEPKETDENCETGAESHTSELIDEIIVPNFTST